ncbi:hypothetical protein FRC04_011475 [Tulasnella sp. 424]|nr:hypothetical protein FRC04_011475 [Tulasnella sp. 424]
MSFLFHNTVDFIQCGSYFGNVLVCEDPAYHRQGSLGAYHATLAVAQVGVDCVSSGLDWIVEPATWLLESLGLARTLPIPDDIFIPKRARFDRWGEWPVNRPFRSQAWAQRNRAGTLEAPGSPTPTRPAPLPSKPLLVSLPLSEKAHNFDTNHPPLSPPTSRDVDTSSSPWKSRKADYWSLEYRPVCSG